MLPLATFSARDLPHFQAMRLDTLALARGPRPRHVYLSRYPPLSCMTYSLAISYV